MNKIWSLSFTNKSTGSMKALNGVMGHGPWQSSLGRVMEEGLAEELTFELRPKKMRTSQSRVGLWQYFPECVSSRPLPNPEDRNCL